jgi:hypothetical protein
MPTHLIEDIKKTMLLKSQIEDWIQQSRCNKFIGKRVRLSLGASETGEEKFGIAKICDALKRVSNIDSSSATGKTDNINLVVEWVTLGKTRRACVPLSRASNDVSTQEELEAHLMDIAALADQRQQFLTKYMVESYVKKELNSILGQLVRVYDVSVTGEESCLILRVCPLVKWERYGGVSLVKEKYIVVERPNNGRMESAKVKLSRLSCYPSTREELDHYQEAYAAIQKTERRGAQAQLNLSQSVVNVEVGHTTAKSNRVNESAASQTNAVTPDGLVSQEMTGRDSANVEGTVAPLLSPQSKGAFLLTKIIPLQKEEKRLFREISDFKENTLKRFFSPVLYQHDRALREQLLVFISQYRQICERSEGVSTEETQNLFKSLFSQADNAVFKKHPGVWGLFLNLLDTISQTIFGRHQFKTDIQKHFELLTRETYNELAISQS